MGILHGTDTNVFEGDVIVVQGKSGAGKTTLLKCVAHLDLYNGRILYRGRCMATANIDYVCFAMFFTDRSTQDAKIVWYALFDCNLKPMIYI
jgi:ABC-type polar amino acid transport system ATPase subunit